VYLRAGKTLSLFNGITWQASSRFEVAAIREEIDRSVSVMVAENLLPRIGMREPMQSRRRKRPAELNVLFLSRIHRVKNLDGALRALHGVKGRITFTVYGPSEDRAYWDDCLGLIRTMPDNVRVQYCGAVTNELVGSIMRDQDLFFLPTRGENFGHVIFEALLGGCPVLISDQTPWRGLEEKGVGWDLPLTDVQRFRAVLQHVTDMGDIEHQRLSQRAAEYARGICLDESRVERNRALFLESNQDSEKAAETCFPTDHQARAAA